MPEEKKEIILNGIPAAPGVMHGPAFVFQHQELDVPVYRIPEAKQDEEKERFDKALLETRSQILSQAATNTLALANNQPQNALQLLG